MMLDGLIHSGPVVVSSASPLGLGGAGVGFVEFFYEGLPVSLWDKYPVIVVDYEASGVDGEIVPLVLEGLSRVPLGEVLVPEERHYSFLEFLV